MASTSWVARYYLHPDGESCEFAITVTDDWAGAGLASRLMHELIQGARVRGIKHMEGVVFSSPSWWAERMREDVIPLQTSFVPGDRQVADAVALKTAFATSAATPVIARAWLQDQRERCLDRSPFTPNRC